MSFYEKEQAHRSAEPLLKEDVTFGIANEKCRLEWNENSKSIRSKIFFRHMHVLYGKWHFHFLIHPVYDIKVAFERWTTDLWAFERWATDLWAFERWATDLWAIEQWATDLWAFERWATDLWAIERWAIDLWAIERWAIDLWAFERWAFIRGQTNKNSLSVGV
ncbi:hypothetical protein PUN28_008364 [Cardiocondyla obscurior]|uniref:Uncharacterized protein n=1 Tax=Cardiocondyla obscurior TaxID=286306 RepID=A0AAW2G2J7_9HYME